MAVDKGPKVWCDSCRTNHETEYISFNNIRTLCVICPLVPADSIYYMSHKSMAMHGVAWCELCRDYHGIEDRTHP